MADDIGLGLADPLLGPQTADPTAALGGLRSSPTAPAPAAADEGPSGLRRGLMALGGAAAAFGGQQTFPLMLMQMLQQEQAAKQKKRERDEDRKFEKAKVTLDVLTKLGLGSLPGEKVQALFDEMGMGDLAGSFKENPELLKAISDDLNAPGLTEEQQAQNKRLYSILEKDPKARRDWLDQRLAAHAERSKQKAKIQGTEETATGQLELRKSKADVLTAEEKSKAALLAPDLAVAELDKVRAERDTLQAKLKAIPKENEIAHREAEAKVKNLESQIEARQDDVEYGKVVKKAIDKGFQSLLPQEQRLYNDKSGDPEARRMRIDVAVEKLRMAEENQMVGIMAGLVKSGVLGKEDQTELLQRIGEVGKVNTERRESAIRDAINFAFQSIGAPSPIQPGLKVKPEGGAKEAPQVKAAPDLPPPGPAGQRIRDKETGQVYQSDGKRWLPQ